MLDFRGKIPDSGWRPGQSSIAAVSRREPTTRSCPTRKPFWDKLETEKLQNIDTKLWKFNIIRLGDNLAKKRCLIEFFICPSKP